MGYNNLVRFSGIYFCLLFLYGSIMSLDTRVRKEEVDAALRGVLDNLFYRVDVRDSKFGRVDIKWTNVTINLRLWPLVTEGGIKQRWGEREMARWPETTECMVAISHNALLCWRLFIDKMCKRWQYCKRLHSGILLVNILWTFLVLLMSLEVIGDQTGLPYFNNGRT